LLAHSGAAASSDAPAGSNKGSATNTPRASKIGLALNISPLLDSASLNNSSVGAGNVDEISEIQSVLSETDKESLDVAMSMMGHLELRQVEDEVGSVTLPYYGYSGWVVSLLWSFVWCLSTS
jgi:hypothetical protein